MKKSEIVSGTKLSFYHQSDNTLAKIFTQALRLNKLTIQVIQELIIKNNQYIKIIVDLQKEDKFNIFNIIDFNTLLWMFDKTDIYKSEVNQLLREFAQYKISKILISNLSISSRQEALLQLCKTSPLYVDMLLEREPKEISQIFSQDFANQLIQKKPDCKQIIQTLLLHLQNYLWPKNWKMTFLPEDSLLEIFKNSKLSKNDYYQYIRPSSNGYPYFVVVFQFYDKPLQFKFKLCENGSIVNVVTSKRYNNLQESLEEAKSYLTSMNFRNDVSIPTFAFDLQKIANDLNPDKNQQIFFAAASSDERGVLVYESKDYCKPHSISSITHAKNLFSSNQAIQSESNNNNEDMDDLINEMNDLSPSLV